MRAHSPNDCVPYRKKIPRTKAIFFSLILVLISWAFVELLTYFLASVTKRVDISRLPDSPRLSSLQRTIIAKMTHDRHPYVRLNTRLGWALKSDAKWRMYRTNSQGIRATTRYSKTPPHSLTRIVAIGDSFTHADEVSNSNAWPAVLQSLEPRFEVLNLGVPGYGPLQAFGHYLGKGHCFGPKIVLFGYLSENINRLVSSFRVFYHSKTRLPFGKPTLSLLGDNTQWIANPLPSPAAYRTLLEHEERTLSEIGKTDYWYKKYPTASFLDRLPTVRVLTSFLSQQSHYLAHSAAHPRKSAPHRTLLRLIDLAYATIVEHKAIPLFLLFPAKHHHAIFRTSGKMPYFALKHYLQQKSYPYLDTHELMRSDQPEAAYYLRTHFNERFQERLARHLKKRIDLLIQTPPVVPPLTTIPEWVENFSRQCQTSIDLSFNEGKTRHAANERKTGGS